MLSLDRLNPQPLTFGECRKCPYVQSGSAAVCFACAHRVLGPLSRYRCAVCGQTLAADQVQCGNPICGWRTRGFDRVHAISLMTDPLQQTLHRYKYEGALGWGTIFGRVLAGYLQEHRVTMRPHNLIVPSPTYVGPGGSRSDDHISRIVRAAERECDPGDWPFDDLEDPVIVKTQPTQRLAGLTWQERRLVAESEIRASLLVTHPEKVEGQRILMVDDVFTGGHTLREVALALKKAGATEVSQVVLARQPWRG